MNIRAFGFTSVVALFLLTACGGGGDTTGTGNGNGNVTGSFTASIGGQPWTSDGAPFLNVTLGSASGTLVISGQQLLGGSSYRAISLILGRLEGVGTYPLGVDGSTVAGGSGMVMLADTGVPATWSTQVSGNAGTVVITSVTSTRIVGDFSFTAAPLPGQQGTSQTVTGGHFDLALPAGFSLAAGTARASKMSGTIGGASWNAASVTPVGSLQTGSFVLGGGNSTSYMVQITPFPGLSTGIFPLAAGTTITVLQLGTANGWGSTGSTGSVIITSFAGARVAGTFNANLPPIGATSGNVAVSGTFDINLAIAN